jgi:hypothetical protein
VKTTLPHSSQYALLSALTLPFSTPQPQGYLESVLATAKRTIAKAPEQQAELDKIYHALNQRKLAGAIAECALFDEDIRFILACEESSAQSGRSLVQTAFQYLEKYGDFSEAQV